MFSSSIFEPVLAWYRSLGWTPLPFQLEAWQAYLDGANGLITAPTGTGKTHAVWLGIICEYLAKNHGAHQRPISKKLTASTSDLQVVWVTPMRALANDTADSLREPITALGLPWTVELRTSDTASSVRARQRKQLPFALVTTPESLTLMLANKDAAKKFASLRLIVVDEWHELLSNKRGVQTELALSRLRRIAPNTLVWGISATLANPVWAMNALLGPNTHSPRKLINSDLKKEIKVESLMPKNEEVFPWAGYMGLSQVQNVIDVINGSNSALVFTHTRNQAETWYQALLDARPDWAGVIGLHHSAISLQSRKWIEDALRAGIMRCVVCTSSLDLGVDFPKVERVIQIGSPKGVARLTQRAGRSGHAPGKPSAVYIAPTHALELLEISAVRKAVQAGVLEQPTKMPMPFDVLIQHVVSMGLAEPFSDQTLLQEVRDTLSFQDITDAEWQWVMDFVSGGGPALKSYSEFGKIRQTESGWVVTDGFIARQHRMNIGTIMGDISLIVKYLRGGHVGNIEESFASRLREGDKFTLAGKVLQFVRLRDDTVWVRRAKNNSNVIPRWSGSLLPLSGELTYWLRERLLVVQKGIFDDEELCALEPLFKVQSRWSKVPSPNELLIEHLESRDGYELFIFPLEGRLVNEGLAMLMAYRLAKMSPRTISFCANEYGFSLLSATSFELNDAVIRKSLTLDNLIEDMFDSLNMAEMAKRQFREIARVSGLITPRVPGKQKGARQLQASAGLLYEVFEKYDPNNLLLAQARLEVLAKQLDFGRLQTVLRRIENGAITLVNIPHYTPFSFPLFIERIRQTISSETLSDRIRALQAKQEKWASQ